MVSIVCLKCKSSNIVLQKVLFLNNSDHLWCYCQDCHCGKAIPKINDPEYHQKTAIPLADFKTKFVFEKKKPKKIIKNSFFLYENPDMNHNISTLDSHEKIKDFYFKLLEFYNISISKSKKRSGNSYRRLHDQSSEETKKFGQQHNAKNHNSEVWFRYLWQKTVFNEKGKGHLKHRQNYALGYFIPDFMSSFWGYIIEVDGDSHNNLKQQERDQLKEKYYKKYGFKTFRVKAYDIEDFKRLRKDIILHKLKLIHIRRLKMKKAKNFLCISFLSNYQIFDGFDWATLNEEALSLIKKNI